MSFLDVGIGSSVIIVLYILNRILKSLCWECRKRDSVVSIVTRLRDSLSGIRNLTGAKILSFLKNVAAGCGALPASCAIGTGDSFAGAQIMGARC
jgi:hypothetical protein